MSLKKHSLRITQLDADRDFEEIIQLLQFYIFPWDIHKSLEFALFRTYAVRSISGLLSRTGEFKHRPRKRYDDTELILSEIAENGLDSDMAKRAFRRLNYMHNAYPIDNQDMVYVLSTFIFEPIRWLEKFGYRGLTDHEKAASFKYHQELGKRMGIKDIPPTIEAFEAFNLQYEQQQFIYADTNREIGDYTVNLLLGFYLPKWLWPLGRPIVYAMMDDLLLEAMDYPKAPKWLQKLVHGSLKLRARFLRRRPERKNPYYWTKIKRPTYPEGYKIEELGTFPSKHKRTQPQSEKAESQA